MKAIFGSIRKALSALANPFDPDASYYRSQDGQDRFILNKIYKKSKRGGFFIEMGAADGILLSNTHVFEKRYGWKGILVEPSHRYLELVKNRSATCVRACVGDSSTNMFLLEIPGGMYLSKDANNTLRSISVPAKDAAEARDLVPQFLEREEIDPSRASEFPLVEVPVISLTNLLEQNGSPPVIDYFSLDVEGHEDEVFRGFEFNRFRFNVINIERPSSWLQSLLAENGYKEFHRNSVDVFFRHELFAEH